MTEDPRVARLLEFSRSIRPRELFPVLHDEAALLIEENPFAFALAATLDRGTKAEIVWTQPYYLQKRLGTLSPDLFVRMSVEELERIFRSFPVRLRYITDAPRTVKELSELVIREYDGDVTRIWRNRASNYVKATFQRIHGVGPGIASMIVLLLERCFGIRFSDIDHRVMDVKPDVHIMRVFHRLGFIIEPTETEALKAARRLNPDYPGALDPPTWIIGKKWCTPMSPNCNSCPLNGVCPSVNAAIVVKSKKWDIRGETTALGGSPHSSLRREIFESMTAGIQRKFVVFEDLARATGPKIHSIDCSRYQKWLENPTTTTTWHGPYDTLEEARRICEELSRRENFRCSEHTCVRR